MSVLFFNLRGVPADEADDVRKLLTVHDIAYYETSAGSWGISLPALWLYEASDLEQANRLFQDYQMQRCQQQRTLYAERKRLGLQPGFLEHNLKHPLRFILYCGISGLLVYVSLHWIIRLWS